MPFLKTDKSKYFLPRSKRQELLTLKNGLRHAVFSVPGDKYIGEWKANKKEGKGALHTRSDRLYEGDWERSYRHGFGILSNKLPNQSYKSQYLGDWRNGYRDGYGMCFYEDGGFYEGQWKRGKRHGHGKMWFADKSFYEGQWAKDKFHGLGIFVQTNGNRYEGEWNNDIKQGRGIFYHLDSGQKQQGAWDNGLVVCSTMIDIYYRQSGQPSSEYPIQAIPICLQDPDGVYIEKEDAVLKKVGYEKSATTFIEGVKELRNIVWGDDVTDW